MESEEVNKEPAFNCEECSELCLLYFTRYETQHYLNMEKEKHDLNDPNFQYFQKVYNNNNTNTYLFRNEHEMHKTEKCLLDKLGNDFPQLGNLKLLNDFVSHRAFYEYSQAISVKEELIRKINALERENAQLENKLGEKH